MRKILYPILLLFLFFHTNAQQNLNQYSRVKIDLTNHSILDVARLGLEADHGDYAKGKDTGLIEVFLIGQGLNMDYIAQLEEKIEKLIGRNVSFYLASKFVSDQEHILLFNSKEK